MTQREDSHESCTLALGLPIEQKRVREMLAQYQEVRAMLGSGGRGVAIAESLEKESVIDRNNILARIHTAKRVIRDFFKPTLAAERGKA